MTLQIKIKSIRFNGESERKRVRKTSEKASVHTLESKVMDVEVI